MVVYRREIDGIRAIAVLAVILFHSNIFNLDGGFIGVDVFFVISGYLITANIISDIENGKFSIINFYEKRLRRILPALYFIVLISIFFSWLWLLPTDMKRFSQSLVSVSVFASNIFFWKTDNYFDISSETKPLLHTWSLAVEEQFYLLFPPFLMFVWKLGKNKSFFFILLLSLLSFILADFGSTRFSSMTFFLLPTRAWELLVGSLVGIYYFKNNNFEIKKIYTELGSFLGLLLILISIFLYNKNTPFPSIYAIAPTLGAALLIVFANSTNFVGRILGSTPFVAVGLISYSAYLWHQPLFAFARLRGLTETSLSVNILLFLLIFPLSTFTWQFIEKPFRKGYVFSFTKLLFICIVINLSIFVFGLIGHFTDGIFYRKEFNEKIVKLEHRLKINYGLNSDCNILFASKEHCRTSDIPEILIWGDSYAMHLTNGLLASEENLKIIQATVSVCGPVLDIAPYSLPTYDKVWANNCIKFNDQVFKYIQETKSLKYIIVSSPFTQYVGKDSLVLHRNGKIVNSNTLAEDSFRNTLKGITDIGKVPVIFSPTPSSGFNTGRCLLKAILYDSSIDNCNFDLKTANINQLDVNIFLNKFSSSYNIIWLSEGICPDDKCIAYNDNLFIYRDDGHLSIEGSAYIGKKMNFYKMLQLNN